MGHAYAGVVPGIEVWSQFDHDPRLPANAAMRASDRDRAVIETVLADAFAEGRITSSGVRRARRRGDRESHPGRADAARRRPARSARAPRSSIAEAAGRCLRPGPPAGRLGLPVRVADLLGDLGATSIGGLDDWNPQFPWPLFVMLGTGLNAARVAWQKDEIIAEETRRLEKKERKELRQQEDEG